jgi:hypothetical protein
MVSLGKGIHPDPETKNRGDGISAVASEQTPKQILNREPERPADLWNHSQNRVAASIDSSA